jgi:V-type H+-transporting ATPase subunit a
MKPFKGGIYSYISVAASVIKQDAMIYSLLNMMKLGEKTYKGLAWCTKSNEISLTNLNETLSKIPDFVVPRFKRMEKTSLTPPTATYTNEFIAPFQSIVDTYGIPNYQEANPALFSIITFPFMFGIMFGDFCHGLVLATIAIYVCLEKETLEKNKSMLCALIPIRYLILLMGLFAAFCGFIYNDFASVPLNVFKSCYTNNIEQKIGVRQENCVYPFGLDHKWYISDNELAYVNSFKMKISVVFGIAQMLLGIILKGSNAIHFGKPLDFFFEFIPQLLFLGGLFGYMIIIIFVKWGTNWSFVGNNAPSVISFLIDLVLNMGDPGPTPFYGDGSLQKRIALIVLALSLVCVPWMLIFEPLLLKKEHQPLENAGEKEIVNGEQPDQKEMEVVKGYKEADSDKIKEPKISKVDPEEDAHKLLQKKVKNALDTSVLIDKPEKFDFSEVFVHQLIECIEFVLGTISNTASYLRLWALSLAHAQLSKVFFDKVMANFLRENNSIGV